MAVMVKFENVEAGEPEPIELGPFEGVVISYVYLASYLDLESSRSFAIATCSFAGGVWQVYLDEKLTKQYGNQYNGSEWTDITIRSV